MADGDSGGDSGSGDLSGSDQSGSGDGVSEADVRDRISALNEGEEGVSESDVRETVSEFRDGDSGGSSGGSSDGSSVDDGVGGASGGGQPDLDAAREETGGAGGGGGPDVPERFSGLSPEVQRGIASLPDETVEALPGPDAGPLSGADLRQRLGEETVVGNADVIPDSRAASVVSQFVRSRTGAGPDVPERFEELDVETRRAVASLPDETVQALPGPDAGPLSGADLRQRLGEETVVGNADVIPDSDAEAVLKNFLETRTGADVYNPDSGGGGRDVSDIPTATEAGVAGGGGGGGGGDGDDGGGFQQEVNEVFENLGDGGGPPADRGGSPGDAPSDGGGRVPPELDEAFSDIDTGPDTDPDRGASSGGDGGGFVDDITDTATDAVDAVTGDSGDGDSGNDGGGSVSPDDAVDVINTVVEGSNRGVEVVNDVVPDAPPDGPSQAEQRTAAAIGSLRRTGRENPEGVDGDRAEAGVELLQDSGTTSDEARTLAAISSLRRTGTPSDELRETGAPDDVGNFEVGIPGTDRTAEDVTQDAAEAFSGAADEFGGGAGDVTAGLAGIAQGDFSVNVNRSAINADGSDGPAPSVDVTGRNETVGDTTAAAVSGVANLANLPGAARTVDEGVEAGAFALSGLDDAAGEVNIRPGNLDLDGSNAPVIDAGDAGPDLGRPVEQLQRRGRRRARQALEANFRIRPENLDLDGSNAPVIEAREGRAEEIAGGAVAGLAGAATGRLAGPALGRARRTGSDLRRTAGSRPVSLEEITSDEVARNVRSGGEQGERFPSADDPEALNQNPAQAIREQARERTPDAIAERFGGAGEGATAVFKKALDVEPESGQQGNRGFETREGEFVGPEESPGSFISSDLSPNFLRINEGSGGTPGIIPGLPSGSNDPTGVLIKTDIENPDVSSRSEFNQELRDADGDPTARAVDPDLEGAGGADEIEAVLPPGTEFRRAAGGGIVRDIARRVGIGSDFSVRIDTPQGSRRVPLRPAEPDRSRSQTDADADTDADTDRVTDDDGDTDGDTSPGADDRGPRVSSRPIDPDPVDRPAPVAPVDSSSGDDSNPDPSPRSTPSPRLDRTPVFDPSPRDLLPDRDRDREPRPDRDRDPSPVFDPSPRDPLPDRDRDRDRTPDRDRDPSPVFDPSPRDALPDRDRTPDREPRPDPDPRPDPSPTPDPRPDPSPTPDPRPDPSPTPDPRPDPSPTPDPRPDPSPTPDPRPDPSPTPDRTPTIPTTDTPTIPRRLDPDDEEDELDGLLDEPELLPSEKRTRTDIDPLDAIEDIEAETGITDFTDSGED